MKARAFERTGNSKIKDSNARSKAEGNKGNEYKSKKKGIKNKSELSNRKQIRRKSIS